MRKLKGIILVVLLVASVLMPFNIYVDTLITTSNITGCHITDVSFSDSTAYNNITCDMDNEYYGYANMAIQYYVGSSNTPTSQGYFITVSGNSFDVVIPTSNTSINRQKTISVIQINDNHIYLKDDMNYQDIMWMFPVESYIFVNYMFNQGFENVGFNTYGNYFFPRFLEDNSKYALQYNVPNNSSYYMIFITSRASNVYSIDSFKRYFSFNENITLDEFTAIFAVQGARLCKLKFSNSYGSTQALNFKFINTSTTETFIPIYFGNVTSEYISNDFALNFGLSNRLLNDLDTIANGTSGSQSSVNDVDSQNQQFESDRDDLIDIEDNFNEDMNDKLDVIDTNTGVSGFGGYFMNSAVWVRTQFDRLTNNTPYGSLIVYGMTLGLALLLLGKVFL